jgi:hypothetical protein
MAEEMRLNLDLKVQVGLWWVKVKMLILVGKSLQVELVAEAATVSHPHSIATEIFRVYCRYKWPSENPYSRWTLYQDRAGCSHGEAGFDYGMCTGWLTYPGNIETVSHWCLVSWGWKDNKWVWHMDKWEWGKAISSNCTDIIFSMHV